MPTNPRALYRHLLRELPPISKTRTKLHNELRTHFSGSSSPTTTTITAPLPHSTTEQFLTYLRSQRTYVALLERYNPGLTGEVDTAENVRLTARRVGMDLGSMAEKK